MNVPDRKTVKHDALAATAGAIAGLVAWHQAPWWTWPVAGAAGAVPARRRLNKNPTAKRAATPVRKAVQAVNGRVAADRIRDTWPDLLPARWTKDGGDAPVCDRSTVTPDRIVLEVTCARHMIRPADFAAFTDDLMHRLGGRTSSYRLHPVDTRDPGKPRRLTVTIDLRGIPTQVVWTEVPALENRVGFPIGLGAAGRRFVWTTTSLDIGGIPERGKSALLALLMWTAIHDRTAHPQGWRVILIDPKGGTKEHAGVGPLIERHTGAGEQNAAVRDLARHVSECGALVDEYGAWERVPDTIRPKPVLLVLDEYNTWTAAKNRPREQAIRDVETVIRGIREFDGRVVRAAQTLSVAKTGGDGAGDAREMTAGVAIGRMTPAYARMILGVAPSDDDYALLPDQKGAAFVRGLRDGENRVELCQLAYLHEDARVAPVDPLVVLT